jgi:peptidoglycan/xylan/chitin deacetylase (PgdA/CDA1 family)
VSRKRTRPGTCDSPYARRGQIVRSVYLVVSGLYWLLMRLTCKPGGIVVLCYHSVRAVQFARFIRQMGHVAHRAVRLAALDREPPAAGQWPNVCVTFDDGFEGVLKDALPAMQALGVPAAVFAVPGNLGAAPAWGMPADHPDRGELLASGAQLAAAAQRGMCSVGSHTLSHTRLPGLPATQFVRELTDSKATLERLLQADVADLAFPYGEYDGDTVAHAYSAGYRRLFTLEPHVWRGGRRDEPIGRFLVSPGMWHLEFVLTCAGAYAWLAAWRRFWRRLRGAGQLQSAAAQEAVVT